MDIIDLRQMEVVRENSIFDPDNLSAKKIAKAAIGELIQDLVLWTETDDKEIVKVLEARKRANYTQATLIVLDNLWTKHGKHPDINERKNTLFGYIGKTIDEMNIIIDDEYKAVGTPFKASDGIMANWSINTGGGLQVSNPAVPEYGTIFSKYYAGHPDLAKDLLLLQFGARILMMYFDESKTFPLPRIDRDPEYSCLRRTGGALLDLINIRTKDLTVMESDPLALPEFPMRGEQKEKYCRFAVHALKVAFDGDTFADKGQSVHTKGLVEIFASKNYSEKEADIVIKRLEDARKRITNVYKAYCPEAVSEMAYSPA